MSKIFVVGPSWVGDMMMSQSLYRTLKSLHPDCEIEVMAPEWCRPLLNKMPEVAEAISMPIGHGEFNLKKRYQLGQALKVKGYDQAYILPNSFKSALIPFFAKIPKRTGWKGEMRYGLINDLRNLDKTAFPRMVERYVALAYDKNQVKQADDFPNILYPRLMVSKQEIINVFHSFSLDLNDSYIGFCPGAEFGPAKRWPDYHYATLANRLIEEGKKIILFGSKKDYPIGESILKQLVKPEFCINLAGITSLEQAVNLIAGCDAIVTNDSGLMHIAASLERPMVALYGPTSPEFTPPLSHKAKVIRLITGFHKIRKGDSDEGYHQSLIDIQPSDVLNELQLLLSTEQ